MPRWNRTLAILLLAFTCWAMWRSHPMGKAALVLPAILLGVILIGVSAAALWRAPTSYRHNWVAVFPWVTMGLCFAFYLGQLLSTYTAWLR